MPVTFTFYRISERKPEHNQQIIWLQNRGDHYYHVFEPREVTVEYSWEELDDKGNFTGCSSCYDPDEIIEDTSNLKLCIILDGHYADENDLWCPVENYWNALGLELELDD